MEKRFRALRLIALFFKIMAWISLIGTILFSILIVVLGALQGETVGPSELFRGIPFLAGARGIIAGILVSIVLLISALILFILLYAVAESIDLGLAIEYNTREMAYYLRGEATLPAPPPDAIETEQEVARPY